MGSCRFACEPEVMPRRGSRLGAALERLDDDHLPAAVRARWAMIGRLCGGVAGPVVIHRVGFGGVEEFAGTGDIGLAVGAGEQPVVTDAVAGVLMFQLCTMRTEIASFFSYISIC